MSCHFVWLVRCLYWKVPWWIEQIKKNMILGTGRKHLSHWRHQSRTSQEKVIDLRILPIFVELIHFINKIHPRKLTWLPKTSWWFQIFCSPLFGEVPILTNIFQFTNWESEPLPFLMIPHATLEGSEDERAQHRASFAGHGGVVVKMSRCYFLLLRFSRNIYQHLPVRVPSFIR